MQQQPRPGDPMEPRKRPDGQNQPAVQVYGFRLEGRTPSPDPGNSILNEEAIKISASPTPVIIPPQFQVRVPVCVVLRGQHMRRSLG